jgi:hypothetical protein
MSRILNHEAIWNGTRSPSFSDGQLLPMIAAEELQAIRGRAQAFAYSWAGESSEQQGKVTFWDEIFTIFGFYGRLYATHEFMLRDRRRVDLFWKRTLLVEKKGRGLEQSGGASGSWERTSGHIWQIRPSPAASVECGPSGRHPVLPT